MNIFRTVLLVTVAASSLEGLGGVAQPARAEDGPSHAAPRQLTMATAIEIALTQNPQLAIEAENIVVAEARARADSTLRLPLPGVRTNVLFWDRPIVADLGPDIGKITIRDRVTGTL